MRKQALPKRALITREEYDAVVELMREAMESSAAIGYNGRREQAYEQAFVDFMGGGFADGVNSGTNAMYTALLALELEPFSEVVVPVWSDPGGVMPVALVGCVPVVADSDRRSFNTNAEEIRKVITDRTRAIIVAHIAGEAVDMDPVVELAREKRLYLIEDCAQAHGTEYKGRKLGTYGDISMFSTMYGKHHATGGQGGVVYVSSEDMYWKVKRIADRGKPYNLPNAEGSGIAELSSDVDHLSGYTRAGLNNNLNELSAAIGLVQIRRLPENLDRRRRFAETLGERLWETRSVRLGYLVPDSRPAYWFLRFRLNTDRLRVDKESFCAAVKAEGFPSIRTHFWKIPCTMPWFTERRIFGTSGFPWDNPAYGGDTNPQPDIRNTREAVLSHFCLDINERFGDQEVEDLIAAVKKIEAAYGR